jgi:ribonuclease-3
VTGSSQRSGRPAGKSPPSDSPDSHDREESLDSLEAELDYRFRDRGLFEMSLRHSSYAHEAHEAGAGAEHGSDSNERLEFLGDAVIGMVVAHLLYAAHPGWAEGDLTRALHRLVDRVGLARLARQVGLGAHLELGRTELNSNGRAKDTILADGMEAVLGAMYLDGGVAPVERFVRRVFAPALAADAPRVEPDPKTRFQEWAMSRFGAFPRYRVVHDSEVEGDESRFTVEVLLDEVAVARGTGRSKRLAEKQAADAACEKREELSAAPHRGES